MGIWTQLAAQAAPSRPAWTTASRTLSHGDLARRVAIAAAWLRAQGLQRGDTVALQLGPDDPWVELFLGASTLGVASLPLNDRYTAHERDTLLADAAPALLIAGIGPAEGLVRARPCPELDAPHAPRFEADDAAPTDRLALLYTSGTTGRPKGAPLTHAQVGATVEALHQAWAWNAHDRLFHALPLYHVHGLFVGALGALRAGAEVVRRPSFEAQEAARLIAERACTVFMGVPTFHHRLLRAAEVDPALLAGLRLVTSGSAPLAASDFEAFQARFGHRIVERYGMTEIGIVLSNPLAGVRKPGSVGLPLPGVQRRVMRDDGAEAGPGEVGELWIAGPSVFDGYLGLPREAALTGPWMRTGDLGYLDPDGYTFLVGRASALILVGGFNVYPAEVEAALLAAPGVREAAVFGLPDPDRGEVPVAAIVGEPGLSAAALREAARARLAGYKVPVEIRFFDALPRNAMGKVVPSGLREAWTIGGDAAGPRR